MYIKIMILWIIGLAIAPYQSQAQQPVDTLSGKRADSAINQLKEVVISNTTPLVEQQADKTIIHTDALIANAGVTAYEVLERSPGIVIQNGTITMKGKPGVLVLVDNKPVYLTGAELESLLKSMPSDGLTRIELMTNPPAKYDAAGNAGIINIITRKNKTTGFNGGLNLVLRQSKQISNYNTVFVNYRKDKFNFSANVSGGYRQTFEDLNIYRRYLSEDGRPLTHFDQNAYSTSRGGIGRVKAGIDYYHSEHTTWGLGFTGNLWKSERIEKIDGINAQEGGPENYRIQGSNTEKALHKDGWLNLNYRHAFTQPGRELTMDADYLVYRHDPDPSFRNDLYVPASNYSFSDLLEGKLNSDIRIYTFKADYIQPVAPQWRLDAGIKTAYTHTDNVAAYMYTTDGISQPDYDLSNHFIYKEQISAGYLSMNREGKRLSLQLGLRLENTQSKGHQLGNMVKADSVFERSYTNLFPTFYVLYKLDTAGNHQVGINYGRRIDRPYFQDLNPFVTPIDKFTYYAGNPFLKPAFTHSLELAYSFRDMLTITLSYSNNKDNVNETVAILNGIFYSKPDNIGSRVVKSITMDARKALMPWLNVHLYAEWTHIHARTDFYTGPLDSKGSFVLLNPDCQVRLGKTWNLELSGRYISKVYNVQLETAAYWMVNAGVQKRLSDAASIKLSVRDIAYTQVNSGTIYNLSQTEASWKNKTDTRMAVLSFNYRFGKAIAGQRKHEATGAQGEQSRVKN